jgi:hypothetical protein
MRASPLEAECADLRLTVLDPSAWRYRFSPRDAGRASGLSLPGTHSIFYGASIAALICALRCGAVQPRTRHPTVSHTQAIARPCGSRQPFPGHRASLLRSACILWHVGGIHLINARLDLSASWDQHDNDGQVGWFLCLGTRVATDHHDTVGDRVRGQCPAGRTSR